MRTVIPIECGQRFRSIADSVPVIADSGSRRRLQGLTGRCRCQAFHASPPCRHQLSSHPLVRSAPSFRSLIATPNASTFFLALAGARTGRGRMKRSAGDCNHESADAENPEPGDTPEVIRDRAYTRQTGEALRLAHENKLAPIDPKEVIRAAKAEITETHVQTAREVARAWDHVTNHIAPGRRTLAPSRCAASASRTDAMAAATTTLGHGERI